jgi:kynurenine formamidase
MTVFPGDPQVRLELESGGGWQVTRLRLGSHSGTHVDSPRHLLPGGPSLDELPPERFQGPGVVIEVMGEQGKPIEPQQLDWGSAQKADMGGAICVLRTGWSRHWGTPRYQRHPYLSAATAELLVRRGAGMVAIDALNPDDTRGGASVVHRTLLAAGVLIAENLTNLDSLGPAGSWWWFSLLPLRLQQGDGSPVRAVAAPLAHPGDQQ